MSYTPGPWQSRDDYTTEGFVTIIANADGEEHPDGSRTYTYDTVCCCEDEYGERLQNVAANVRLITAAPDMLKALEHLDRWFDTDPEVLSAMDADTLADHNRQRAIIRAALAKARL